MDRARVNLLLDKMAAILADDIFHCIFLNENDRFLIQISLKYVPRSPFDSKSALAWRQTGGKPLPEPMMTQFIDAYMWHYIRGTRRRRVERKNWLLNREK